VISEDGSSKIEGAGPEIPAELNSEHQQKERKEYAI